MQLGLYVEPGAGAVPAALNDFWEPIPYAGLPLSILNTGEVLDLMAV